MCSSRAHFFLRSVFFPDRGNSFDRVSRIEYAYFSMNKKFIRSKIYPHAIQFGKSIGFYSISLPLIINVSLSYVFEFFRNEKSLFPSQSHRLTRVKRLCKANPSNLSKGEQFLSFRHSNTPHREITHHFSIGNIAILPIDRGRSSIIFIIEALDWDRSIL